MVKETSFPPELGPGHCSPLRLHIYQWAARLGAADPYAGSQNLVESHLIFKRLWQRVEVRREGKESSDLRGERPPGWATEAHGTVRQTEAYICFLSWARPLTLWASISLSGNGANSDLTLGLLKGVNEAGRKRWEEENKQEMIMF